MNIEFGILSGACKHRYITKSDSIRCERISESEPVPRQECTEANCPLKDTRLSAYEELLSAYVGETGESESAIEVITRLLDELDNRREVMEAKVEKNKTDKLITVEDASYGWVKSEEKVCRWTMVSEDEDDGAWDWYKSECGSTSDHEQIFCHNCRGKVVMK